MLKAKSWFCASDMWVESCNRNDMQYTVETNQVIDCPKSVVGRVIGKQGETLKALERLYGARIEIHQTLDPTTITIAGQALAVDSAADAVRELINGGGPCLGTPRTACPRSGGPEGPGSFDGAPSLPWNCVVHDICLEYRSYQ